MRVLVADDDPVYRRLLQELFEQWDFEVVLTSDGEEAWQVLQGEDPPKLIVLDWMMPHMDGFEVCKKLRQERPDDNPFVIIMTSGRKKREIMRIIVAGADDYLIKPFDPMDMKIHLRTAMRVLKLQEELRAVTKV